MSRYGRVQMPEPVPDYELNPRLHYQVVYVTYEEEDEEIERLALFQERVNEAIVAGYTPIGSPVHMKEAHSRYYLVQGIMKTGGTRSNNNASNAGNVNNNNNSSDPNQGGGKRKTRRHRRRS